jgi:mannose-1-phosphate guanylyltransferase
MSDREERVAKNEAASREINEKIEDAQEETSSGQHIRMVCECGQENCDRVVAITLVEYERLRGDPRQFVVARDHVMADVERVVSETDRFVIVAKREGTPAAVATDEDPRD